MKKLFAIAALAAFTFPATAGDGLCGYRCENMCYLAKQANSHRAYGTEALTVSTVARAEVVKQVELNLARI